MTKKVLTTFVFFVFILTTVSILSCPCVHASQETTIVKQVMSNHCGHQPENPNEKTAHSKNNDCCGQCKTESVSSSHPSLADINPSALSFPTFRSVKLFSKNIINTDVRPSPQNNLFNTPWDYHASLGVLSQPRYIVFEALLF